MALKCSSLLFFIISHLSLTSHPRSTYVLQDTRTLGTCRVNSVRIRRVHFDIICGEVVYPPEEKLSLFTQFFLQSKIFLMYTTTSQPNVEYLKTSEILKVSFNFDICSFVQISSNLGIFGKLKNVQYFGK